MTKKDIMKTKTDQELIKLLTDTREALRTERFSTPCAPPPNPNHLGQLRKVIARALTEQSRRLSKSASRPKASGHATA